MFRLIDCAYYMVNMKNLWFAYGRCVFLYNSNHFMLFLCHHFVSVCLYTQWFSCNNFCSSLMIILNFYHNDPWPRIKVGIDLGDCNTTSLQTRGLKMQKTGVFCCFFLYLQMGMERLLFICYWWSFLWMCSIIM